MKKNPIVIIEPCNFIDFPTGGQLTFAKQLITIFQKDSLLLFGITNNKSLKIGEWHNLNIDGVQFDFFPYACFPNSSKKPLVPLRLRNYFALKRHKAEINKIKEYNIITQSPDSLLALKGVKFENICYLFAGAENPLSISRYKFARNFAFLFDYIFLKQLTHVHKILAAADRITIQDIVHRSKGLLKAIDIVQFPTRIDTTIFRKRDQHNCRLNLNLPKDQIIIVTTGRLNWFKGWKLLIDSFELFYLNNTESHLYFIGNGEDDTNIINYAKAKNIQDFIHVEGYKAPQDVAEYLNAADLFVMGSYKEGWSTSLLEAIACGTPSCVTNFSSAKEMINEGKNGFVVETRDSNHFAIKMQETLRIDRSLLPKEEDIQKCSLSNLRKDLLKVWELI